MADHDKDESSSAASPSINLQIVSPSPGVHRICLQGLEASTTVGQLKARIRDSLPRRPAGHQQRLIHRGHYLRRDDQPLREVFDSDELRNGDQQTIHLVLADADHARPWQAAHAVGPNSGRANQAVRHAPRPHPHPADPLPHVLEHMSAQIARSRQAVHELVRQDRDRLRRMMQQQARVPVTGVSGQAELRHYVWNNEPYTVRVDVLHRTVTVVHPGSLGTTHITLPLDTRLELDDVGHILMPETMRMLLGAADANTAARILVDVLRQRRAPGQAAAGPPPSSPEHGPSLSSTAPPFQPMVYVLSSPQGPRFLLCNGPAEAYTSAPLGFRSYAAHLIPRLYMQPHRVDGVASQPLLIATTPAHHAPRADDSQHPNQARNRRDRVVAARDRRGAALPAQGPNPVAGAAAAALADVRRNVWLIIRLGIFVWWFTSSDSSWSRWITMIGIALAVFVINTGVLNNVAHQAWEPFRRHLEGLLPLADPNQRAPPGPGPHLGAGLHGGRVAEPEPARTAARLMAERRNANGNWVVGQIRRLERAGLLFLASIAPGVAERHIARLEAQEQVAEAQRRRREQDRLRALQAARHSSGQPSQAGAAMVNAQPARETPDTEGQEARAAVDEAAARRHEDGPLSEAAQGHPVPEPGHSRP